METLIIAGLAGVGYFFLDKKKKQQTVSKQLTLSKKPKQTIYQSNYVNQANHKTHQLLSKRTKQSLGSQSTQLIHPSLQTLEKTPPGLTKKIQQKFPSHSYNYLDKQFQTSLDKPKNATTLIEGFKNQPRQVKSSLTGTVIKNFKHNNMTPFFGGSIKQNIDESANETLLRNHTGNYSHTFKKDGRKPLFKPQPNIGVDKFGDMKKFIRSRANDFKDIRRNNVLPFKQVKVGPGLNQGYTDKPTGGFQQANSRDYLMPKNIDELRVKTNPKKSFGGRIKAGKALQINRPLLQKVEKHRPDRYYKNGPERYLTTTGAVKAAKKRVTIQKKKTDRCLPKDFTGIAAPNEHDATRSRAAVQHPNRQNFLTSGPRNLAKEGEWGNVSFGDYGRDNILINMNSRDITGTRTHISNLKGPNSQKTILQDTVRTTRKENFIGNSRSSGNYSQSTPANLPVYDPNDVARTTIKETTENNLHQGNFSQRGPKKHTVYDPNDVAKTTIKETTEDNHHLGNMGFSNSDKNVGYVLVNGTMKAITTQREISLSEYTGNADGDVRSKGTGYLTNDYYAPETHKQFTSDNDYTGIASAEAKKTMSYNDIYNSTLKETAHIKEKLAKGRLPAHQGPKKKLGQESVCMNIKKNENDRKNNRKNAMNNIYSTIQSKHSINLTNQPCPSRSNIMASRIEPDILETFKKNPFTKSLQSVV